MKRDEELRKIKEEVLNCKKCLLYKTRILPVIGEGNHQAKIMLVGEGPGASEDRTGHPFCGAAGKILDELLNFVGIKRKEIYITNLVKCHPVTPDLKNRAPELAEIKVCASYLERQIEIIRPKAICPLGRYSMRFLMQKFGLGNKIEPISKIHGKIFKANSLFQNIKIAPFYHPAVTLYNPNLREILREDFKILEKLTDIIE